MRKSARLAYCVLFTLAMVLAWVLRDFAKPLIDKIPCGGPNLPPCSSHAHPWLAQALICRAFSSCMPVSRCRKFSHTFD